MSAGLNDFSQHFARALFAVYPEWQPYARVDDEPGISAGSLIVVIPAPSRSGTQLFVFTGNDEITIGFDYFYDHFGWPAGDERKSFSQALERIRSIIDEEICVAVTRHGDEWRGSTMIEPDEIPTPHTGERITVRSWRGTYDTEYYSKPTSADWFENNL